MIEVFKTNVAHDDEALILLEQMRTTFPGYKINFDLDDCDRILRIESPFERIDPSLWIELLRSNGFDGETLPDEIIPLRPKLSKNLSTEHIRPSEIKEMLIQNR